MTRAMPKDPDMPPTAVWDARSQALLEKWLFRHRNPDAVPRWSAAASRGARSLAAVAVAQDPGVLTRMEPRLARRLAEDALDAADLALCSLGETSATPGTAAAIWIREAALAWLRRQRP
jgi:uncharacterized protein YjeT (DUF2065 family)